MKNNNKLIYLLIGLISIWLFIVTINIFNNKRINNEIINEYNVVGFSTDFTKVIDEKKSCIVTINADNKISTGFVYKQIDDKVYILCSYHGIVDAISINTILPNNINVNANLLGYNQYADVALLEINIPFNINALNLVDSLLLKPGEFLINIGTPSLDLSESIELGMFSSIRNIVNSISIDDVEQEYYLDVLQLSSNLKSGYSGSPLLNMNGDVVGMITMSDNKDNCFAISTNEIKLIAEALLNNEKSNRYQLNIKGLYLKDMPSYKKTNLNLDVELISGLYVEKIMKDSICSTVGIKTGDIILSINDINIETLNDYLNILYSNTDSLVFKVLRDNNELEFKVDLYD